MEMKKIKDINTLEICEIPNTTNNIDSNICEFVESSHKIDSSHNGHVVFVKPTEVVVKSNKIESFIDLEIKERIKKSFEE